MANVNTSTMNKEVGFWESPTATLVVLVGGLALITASFWNTLHPSLIDYWEKPLYSHGWLIPVLAVLLIWLRWQPDVVPAFSSVPVVARWWGVGLLTFGFAVRLLFTQWGMEVPEMWSYVICLGGAVLLVGGWKFFVWASPVVVFLVFMLPFPYRMMRAVLIPLQEMATTGSVYMLQMLGYGAYRDGKTITIGETSMEIIEACSGLRMLTIFIAICWAVVLIVERPWWQRVVIVASSVPIAVGVNVLRISMTGMCAYHTNNPELAYGIFHDWAGLVMMPMAIVILLIELAFLQRLVVESDSHHASSIPQAGNPLQRREGSRKRKSLKRMVAGN